MWQPTAEQCAILEAVKGGKSLCIEALAGTGKTSTLCYVASKLPSTKFLYVCFNKAMREDAMARVPDNVTCETTHSLAWADTKPQIRNRVTSSASLQKPKQLLDWLEIPWLQLFPLQPTVTDPAPPPPKPKAHKRTQQTTKSVVNIPPLRFMLALRTTLRNFCISDAEAVSRTHFEDLDLFKQMLAADRVQVDGETVAGPDAIVALWVHWAGVVWQDMTDADNGLCPVTHDAYQKMWALRNAPLATVTDCLLFDEAQDANVVISSLLKSQLAQGLQLVYVGDRNQTLYGFRGACDSMKECQVGTRLALTQTWRFGAQIAQVANALLAKLQCAHRIVGAGPPGRVYSSRGLYSNGGADVVIFRTNAALVGAILRMVARDQSVRVHENFKTNLLNFVFSTRWLQQGKDAGDEPPKPLHELVAPHESWSELQASSEQEGAFPLKNHLAFVNRMGGYSKALGILGNLQLFGGGPTKSAGDGGACCLVTAHQAKGLEWDHVALGGDFRGKQSGDAAHQALDAGKQWAVDEFRILYVAVTRARKQLDVGQYAWLLGYSADRL